MTEPDFNVDEVDFDAFYQGKPAIEGADVTFDVSSEETDSFYGFEPLPRRDAPVSNAMIDDLRDEERV